MSEKTKKSVSIEQAEGGFVINKTTSGRRYTSSTEVAKSMTQAMRAAKQHLGSDAAKPKRK
jgi:hypothetical protein